MLLTSRTTLAVALGAAMLPATIVAQQTPPASAQDRASRIDSIFSFATPATPGCAVGVSQNGQVIVNRAYGLGDVERSAPLSASSIFDIGSTQKQFVAAAVLLLVEDGRVSLSDDIRKYIPELRDYGHRITVDHMLTHTSGIRDWTGMLPMAEEGTDVLQLILRQRGTNFAPGGEWSYSNSGYVLLKEIIARVSGMSFAEFARRRLFEPLGMTSSAYVADILQASGERAIGYQKDGAEWKQFMRLDTNRGGGAIVSTNTGGRMVSHSGGAAGYSTWMGRFTDHDLSIAARSRTHTPRRTCRRSTAGTAAMSSGRRSRSCRARMGL